MESRELAFLFAVLALVGCAEERPAVSKPPPPVWTEVWEFECDNSGSVIRLGMTKDEVLAEIAKAGGPGGIRRPSPEMIRSDVWRLASGTSSGAMPGWIGAARLTFLSGVVVKIERYTGPQPA